MYYAELNTDKYIRETFFPDFNYKGLMIEVGAGPTTFYSMSKHFRENGWRCICVEPNPKFVEAHKLEGNEIYQYACSYEEKKSKFKIVDSKNWGAKNEGISYSAIDIKYDILQFKTYDISEIDVEVIKLDTLLNKLGITNIDFLSIDVEGWEIEVLKGFNIEKYSPKVTLLENYEYDNKYVEYMNKHGYVLHSKVDYNYIFTK